MDRLHMAGGNGALTARPSPPERHSAWGRFYCIGHDQLKWYGTETGILPTLERGAVFCSL